jgi:D-3-phosphoglycerate dehydrogenase
METSFPKPEIKVLLLEGVSRNAVLAFERAGYSQIEFHEKALSEEKLLERIADAHIVGIRSRTHLTDTVLQRARRLIAVGCFCIGTNQVDLAAARRLGVPVFNAPYSNTRSVAELVIAETIMLLRGVPQKNALCHRGGWTKSALGSYEVRGKTLGVVGYGHIGTQVGLLAEALGMQVIFHDVETKLALGNARRGEPGRPARQRRRGQPARAGNGGDEMDDRREATRRDASRRAAAQRLARHRGRHRCARRELAWWPPCRRGCRRVSRRTAGQRRCVRVAAARHGQRDPHAAHRGQYARSAGQHRHRSRQQARALQRQRLDLVGGEFPGSLAARTSAQPPPAAYPPQRAGRMSRINEIFSSGNINIDAQFLQTDAEVGYVVIDVAADRAAGRADQRSSRADTGHAAGAGAVLATDRRSRSLLTLAHVTTGATMPTKTARRRTGSVGAIERHAHGGYERLLRAAQALPAIRVAVAHPCSSEALQAAIESRDEGLIEPILVGRARASTRSRSKPASRWPVSSASTPSTAPPRLPRQCGLRARATPPP